MIHKNYLFVSRGLRGGGAERFISIFTSYMANKGYNVHLVLYDRTETDYQLSDKVVVHMMPDRNDNILGKIKRINDLTNIIRNTKADYIIPFLEKVIVTSLLSSIPTRAKLIFTVRNSPWNAKKTELWSRVINRLAVRFSDAIMVQTEEQGEYYKEYRNKIFVVPNPVGEEFIEKKKSHYNKEFRNIVCVGRLVEQKNFSLAIEAIRRVKEEYPSIMLKIYGRGKLEDDLKQIISDNQLTDNCKLMGRVTDIARVHGESDLFLLSSSFEGMPNALLEAMAVGIPCLSSNCRTGPKDMIDDYYTGLLFEADNIESLTRCLKWALNHPDEMNLMGINGRNAIIEKYSLDNSLRCFLNMCERIIRGK